MPWCLGYLSGSFWAVLVPAASLAAAIVYVVTHPGDGSDEVDVEGGIWVLASGLAIAVCAVAVVVRRRADRARGG